jgi:hypothetical protein
LETTSFHVYLPLTLVISPMVVIRRRIISNTYSGLIRFAMQLHPLHPFRRDWSFWRRRFCLSLPCDYARVSASREIYRNLPCNYTARYLSIIDFCCATHCVDFNHASELCMLFSLACTLFVLSSRKSRIHSDNRAHLAAGQSSGERGAIVWHPHWV